MTKSDNPCSEAVAHSQAVAHSSSEKEESNRINLSGFMGWDRLLGRQGSGAQSPWCVCVISYMHGLHGGLELLDSLPQNRMGSGVLLH